jgi:uncharacterized protein (UPF0276 family)
MSSKPILSGLGPSSIPAYAGIGLRSGHYREVLETQPAVAWLEVHPENFFAAGGKHLHYLEQIRAHYPLSLHGVGLSIGSTDPLNTQHLDKLKRLINRFEPSLVSEHISWGSVNSGYFNDLLPLPYTEEALAHMVTRVGQIQDYLGRTILLENVSSYLQFESSTIPEWEFVAELAERAGCGLLLDVNNIYVNACNHGFDASTYLRAIPVHSVQEIHLAGFTVTAIDGQDVLIDTHSRPVCDEVWLLYRQALQHLAVAIPTLIEWDADLPPLNVLVEEAHHADTLQEAQHAIVA